MSKVSCLCDVWATTETCYSQLLFVCICYIDTVQILAFWVVCLFADSFFHAYMVQIQIHGHIPKQFQVSWYVCMYVFSNVYICMYVYMYVCMYVPTYVRVYVYVRMFIWKNIFTVNRY